MHISSKEVAHSEVCALFGRRLLLLLGLLLVVLLVVLLGGLVVLLGLGGSGGGGCGGTSSGDPEHRVNVPALESLGVEVGPESLDVVSGSADDFGEVGAGDVDALVVEDERGVGAGEVGDLPFAQVIHCIRRH